MNRRRFLHLSAAFACAPRFSEAATWRGRGLGAKVSLTLHGPREETDPVLAALPAWLDAFEDEFSLYRPDSALTRLNRQGFHAGSSRFHALIDHVVQAHRLTGGLFDPTVQPLWQALAQGHDPASAQALIGWHRVAVEHQALRLGPGQRLTLNGIAQGYATDLLKQQLAARGFASGLVNLGEFSALGGPYRLGLSDPIHGQVGQRSLSDLAIATSSPAALPLGQQTHILAPDGRAARWSTVSVEARSATMADALSTAAVFMDRPALRRLKTEAELNRITLIDSSGHLTTL